MSDRSYIDLWAQQERELIRPFLTDEIASPSEVVSILKGATVIGVWPDKSDPPYPFEIMMKVRQPDGQIKNLRFGSDEGGETCLTDEEREWNHFYMQVEDDNTPDVRCVPISVLRYMREFAYKEGTTLAASAAEIREMAIKLYMMSEKLEKRKMDFFRGGHEIHEEITRREREE